MKEEGGGRLQKHVLPRPLRREDKEMCFGNFASFSVLRGRPPPLSRFHVDFDCLSRAHERGRGRGGERRDQKKKKGGGAGQKAAAVGP